ncbi:hypothetical protein ACFQPA_10765 [Halomarina halobia]|uniref:Uncharacterized protein n=1 Tax=Halomarina halobia TaxID=3033386 RepID=A0ABD6AAI3_9EURY|nr:hypothetical protein [Halomarina sp. PSR21]
MSVAHSSVRPVTAGTECAYCGSDRSPHDPVFAEEATDGPDDERESVGEFRNYACLHEWIEAAALVYGTACERSPDG